MAGADHGTARAHSREVDVLIVGAGPVGLSLAYQLGRAGIRTLIVERRSSLSRHPKANGIFSRTMEIYRQWGLSDTIRAGALPSELSLGFTWMTRITGIELGHIMLADSADALQREYSAQSPEMPCFTPQDKLEHMLADAVAAFDCVDLVHEMSAVALEQDAEGATVTLRAADGGEQRARARYVVGADGARSAVRDLAGVTETVGTPMGRLLNIYFESEQFESLRQDRPYQLWFVINPDVRGAFWPVSYANRWIFAPDQEPGMTRENYTDQVCRNLINVGAGAVVDAKIHAVAFWQLEQAIADHWRAGRVFLAGDAAHRFPPHGGYGMNSGIQDAQNLGWKLIAVLRQGSSNALLDTYEAERKPIAIWNTAQTVTNTERMRDDGWMQVNPEEVRLIEDPEAGRAIRERMGAAVPMQRDTVHSHGQQFGAIYQSAAIVSDGTVPPQSTVNTYRVSASPGARAPHVWLDVPGGARVSPVDLMRFDVCVLLTGEAGDAWRAAAARAADALGIELPVYAIGAQAGSFRSAEFNGVYGIVAEGAVLIRPDGHVGWRSAGAVANPGAALEDVLRRILALGTAGRARAGADMRASAIA